jgi:glycosyltransferase involved in cell wall biosynthesis
MLWFTEHVFPKIQSHIPDVSLYIVGQKPHARLSYLHNMANVHLTGWVDSTMPYLHACTIYIAPLRMGSGTRLKLLEAMSSKCAIVATTIASDGMLENAKTGMLVVNTEDEMANSIIDLLHNPEKRQQLGQMALDLVKQHYDWSVLIPHLLKAYKGIGLG